MEMLVVIHVSREFMREVRHVHTGGRITYLHSPPPPPHTHLKKRSVFFLLLMLKLLAHPIPGAMNVTFWEEPRSGRFA